MPAAGRVVWNVIDADAAANGHFEVALDHRAAVVRWYQARYFRRRSLIPFTCFVCRLG